jgi:hypothetical protein
MRLIKNLTNGISTYILKSRMWFQVVNNGKNIPMKNEPVVSYNHMQEDEITTEKSKRIPYSLYILLFIDAILISALSVFVAKILF